MWDGKKWRRPLAAERAKTLPLHVVASTTEWKHQPKYQLSGLSSAFSTDEWVEVHHMAF